MYRKYTLTKTHVINTHNYLLQAQDIATNQPALLHQVLISSETLPSLIEHHAIDKIISESENQNSVNEVKGQFEFYLEQNLLQIRFKTSIQPLSQLSKLPPKEILGLVNALNLDLLISIKQLRSSAPQSLKQMSNINKFYSQFIYKNRASEIVIPFIEDDKIHYYDLFYQDLLGKNKEVESKIDDRMLRSRLSAKMSRKRIEVAEESINSDQVVFEKYVHLLLVLLDSPNVVEMLEQTKKLARATPSAQDFSKRCGKVRESVGDKSLRGFLDLLAKCIHDRSEYNLNIFIKQCQIIQEKHEKVNPTKPSSKNTQPSLELTVNFSELQEDKYKNSKSCIVPKKQSVIGNAKNQTLPSRQSEKKLKTSKSLLNLKFNTPLTPSRNTRSFKKTNGILSKSKQKFHDKANIFQNSWATLTKQSNSPSQSKHNTIYMNSATSNWFSQAIKQNEPLLKLRTFKKTNNFNLTASNTPQPRHNQTNSYIPSPPDCEVKQTEANQQTVFDQRVKEEYLNQFTTVSKREEEEVKEDKFTMTDSFLKEIPPSEVNTPLPLSFKREIVKTINFKYYEQVKRDQSTQKQMKNQSIVNQKHERNKSSQKTPLKSWDESELRTPSVKMETNEKQIRASLEKQASTKKSASKAKNSKEIARPPKAYEQQIEEISFGLGLKKSKVKQTSTPVSNTKSEKMQQIESCKSASQKKQSKVMAPLLPDNQKTMYIDQFVYILRFLKLNSSKLNLPLKLNNNFMFVLNFVYFKSLIQYKNSPTNVYKDLITLLTKKQQKFQSHKDECLLYNIQFESLLTKVKGVERIESAITKGTNEHQLSQLVSQRKQDLTVFYVLSCQSNKLLELIFNELAAYAQTNKFILIQNDTFLLVLQLIYLIALTIIISLQREGFYRAVLESQLNKLPECFGFRYAENAQEYIGSYRKGLEGRSIASLNAKEESMQLINWYNQFK